MSTSVATVNATSTQQKPRRGAGGGGRSSRGRGRGGSGPRRPKAQSDPAPTERAENAETPATPTADTPTVTEQTAVAESTDATLQDDDSAICLICAEPVRYYSVPECDHRTCHICALRLRALWKRQDCTLCKEPQHSLIFTTSPTATFKSFAPNDIPYKDAKLSIFFETQEMMEETLVLLRYNCPDGSCDYIAGGWSDLKLHVRATHGNLMCDLCIRMKKAFSHEHSTYAPNLMPYHLPSIRLHGAPLKAEGVEVQAHPICEYCRECLYDDDLLYAHMREKHEECFICKRAGILHNFFMNYGSLENHFLRDHFPCRHPACIEQKFVVFGTEIDLKGHMVEEHGAEMSSRDMRDVRRVEASFEYEDHRRRDWSGNRGRGGGPSQRQPPNMRRRELGTGLTTNTPTPSGIAPVPPTSFPTPPPDADPVTAGRYEVLCSKIASIAANTPRAAEAVGLSLRSYRNSESTARDFVLTIWNALDQDLDNCSTVVNLVVDALDVEDKKESLLSTWNGFKVEQRDQSPDPVPTSIGTEYAGITGGRVLNAKRQTSRTSRPREQILDSVAAAASNLPWSRSQDPDHFPTLPSTPQPLQQQKLTPGPSRPVQKSAATRANTGQGSSSGFRPQAQKPASVTGPQQTPVSPPPPDSAFPELPTATPNRMPKELFSGNKSLKNISGDTQPTESAWRQEPSTRPSSSLPNPEPDATTTKGKKKKKNKEVLFQMGIPKHA